MRRPAPKRTKSGNGALVTMICLGLLLVGGMIFALVYFLGGGSGGNLDSEMLAYLPAETNLMSSVDVEELLKNEKMKKLLDELFQTREGKRERATLTEVGISEQDVAHIVMGGEAPDGKKDRAGRKADDDESAPAFSVVIRFKKPVDKAKIAKGMGFAEQNKNGKTYFKSEKPMREPLLWFPSDTLMVITASEKQLDALFSKEPSKVVVSDEMQQLAKKMSKGQFWAVASRNALPDDWLKFIDMGKALRLPYLPTELLDAVKDMKGAGLWVKVDGDKVSFGIVGHCANKDAAEKIEKAVQKEIDERRGKELTKDSVAGHVLKKAPDVLKTLSHEVQKTIAVERSGETVEISAEFNINLAQQAVDLLTKP